MSRKAENPYPFKTPLAKLRRAIGLTTVKLGLMVGMNNGWISRLESGLSRPSSESAEKLSSVFRGELTEMHLLYPERFKDWEPSESAVLSLSHLKNSASESHSKSTSAS